MADERLERYFHFDEQDLQANRSGQFSEKQKTRLVREDKYTRKWSLIGGGLLLLIAAIGPFGAVGGWNQFEDLPTKLIFVAGFGVLWTLIWGSMAWRQIRRALFRHEFKMGRAQGRARVVQASSPAGNGRVTFHHELQIGGERFLATTFLGEIVQGTEAIVYFIDRTADDPYNKAGIYMSDNVLSIELVEKQAGSNAPSAILAEDAADLELADSLRKGDKAAAVRRYRAMHGCDFEEARVAVEELAAGTGQ